jgi:hypothetical protein
MTIHVDSRERSTCKTLGQTQPLTTFLLEPSFSFAFLEDFESPGDDYELIATVRNSFCFEHGIHTITLPYIFPSLHYLPWTSFPSSPSSPLSSPPLWLVLPRHQRRNHRLLCVRLSGKRDVYRLLGGGRDLFHLSSLPSSRMLTFGLSRFSSLLVT